MASGHDELAIEHEGVEGQLQLQGGAICKWRR